MTEKIIQGDEDPADTASRRAAWAPLALANLKTEKFTEFKIEAVNRMAAQVSAWDDFEWIKRLLSISNLLNLSNMTAAQLLAKDILVYARDTVPPKLAVLTTKAELDAIDPTADDPFGDSTPWPT